MMFRLGKRKLVHLFPALITTVNRIIINNKKNNGGSWVAVYERNSSDSFLWQNDHFFPPRSHIFSLSHGYTVSASVQRTRPEIKVNVFVLLLHHLCLPREQHYFKNASILQFCGFLISDAIAEAMRHFNNNAIF